MTNRIIRPSNLGKWCGCARKSYANIVAPPARSVPSIAEWVGTAAHAVLAGSMKPLKPYDYMIYDSITPLFGVAKAQVGLIVGLTKHLLAAHGLVPIEWEVPVETEEIQGTIDVLMRKDHVPPEFSLPGDTGTIIGDLKTGQHIPFGTWLQLGEYWSAYSRPEHEAVSQVAVIHVPRRPLGEPVTPTIEFRPAFECADIAERWVRTIHGWVETGRLDTMLPSPGFECAGCQLTIEECPVRIVKKEKE